MGLVQLSCPICSGILEVDESAVGMQIQCPGCLHAITAGALDADLALLNSTDPLAGLDPTSNSESVAIAELGCPHCTAVFQVTSEMEGAEVACPHCQGVVTVPIISAADSTGPSPSISTRSSQTSEGMVLENNSLPPSPQSPLSALPGSALPDLSVGPPTAVDPIGTMLPPQVASDSPPANSRPQPVAHSTATDSPPDAMSTRADSAKTFAGSANSKAILIPTEAGYVAVREPVKTVGRPGQEIELRTLSPDERQSRRFHTNLLMIVFCVLLLLFVFFWLK